MLNWIAFGATTFNVILAIIVPEKNWHAILGWLCASLGWFAVATKQERRPMTDNQDDFYLPDKIDKAN